MTDKEFISEMRSYRIDHLPDGWPAVQTQQIDRLISIIDQLTIERDETKKNHGYSCNVCGALRTECEIMKRTADDKRKETANEIMQLVADRLYRGHCIGVAAWIKEQYEL